MNHYECMFGHTLRAGNTGWWSGRPVCLDCVTVANHAQTEEARTIVAAYLEVGPIPSRQQVGAA